MKTLFQNEFCSLSFDDTFDSNNDCYFAIYEQYLDSEGHVSSEYFQGISDDLDTVRREAIFVASLSHHLFAYSDTYYVNFVIRPVPKVDGQIQKPKREFALYELVFKKANFSLYCQNLSLLAFVPNVYTLSAFDDCASAEALDWSKKHVLAASGSFSALVDHAIWEFGARVTQQQYDAELDDSESDSNPPVLFLIEATHLA